MALSWEKAWNNIESSEARWHRWKPCPRISWLIMSKSLYLSVPQYFPPKNGLYWDVPHTSSVRTKWAHTGKTASDWHKIRDYALSILPHSTLVLFQSQHSFTVSERLRSPCPCLKHSHPLLYSCWPLLFIMSWLKYAPLGEALNTSAKQNLSHYCI